MKKEKIIGPVWIRTENTKAKNYGVRIIFEKMCIILFMDIEGNYLGPGSYEVWEKLKNTTEGTNREMKPVPTHLLPFLVNHARLSKEGIENKWDLRTFILTGEKIPSTKSHWTQLLEEKTPPEKETSKKEIPQQNVGQPIYESTETEQQTGNTFSFMEAKGIEKLLKMK